MSISSAPHISGAKNGEEWTYRIHFLPEADNSSGEVYIIGSQRLKQLLNTKQNSSRWFKCCNCFRSKTDQRGRSLEPHEKKNRHQSRSSMAKVEYDKDKDDLSFGPLGKEDKKLIKKLKELLNVEEIIENIWACKQALEPWRLLTGIGIYHMFILFKTTNWWWSIEKNAEGIIIQRSRQMECVMFHFRQKDRPSVTKMEYDTGTRSMMDLINWLYRENELNKNYHYRLSNCINFANAVFNHMATSKRLSTWSF